MRLGLICVSTVLFFASQAALAQVSPPSDKDLKQLKTWDTRLKSSAGIEANVTKTLVLEVVGKEKKSTGVLQISAGKLRLDIESPDRSQVIMDGKDLWVVQYPPAEYKNAATQVLQVKTNSKKGRSNDLLAILTKGGILEYFTLAGVEQKDAKKGFYLQPKKDLVDFSRAQIWLSATGDEMREIRYWDSSSNETRYEFTKMVLDKKISKGRFKFEMPKNAELSVVGS